MNIAVSACLLGRNCKYDGENNFNPDVAALKEKHHLIEVCPEMEGGLPCPRTPCEICRGRVISKDGRDLTENYLEGARKCLRKVIEEKADLAILQPRSPSCGEGKIYDGTFSSRLTNGDGVFASMLKEQGIPVMKPDTFSVVNN